MFYTRHGLQIRASGIGNEKVPVLLFGFGIVGNFISLHRNIERFAWLFEFHDLHLKMEAINRAKVG